MFLVERRSDVTQLVASELFSFPDTPAFLLTYDFLVVDSLGGSRFDPLFLVSLETSSICVVLEL
jgi:hypothetical protein